MRSIELQQRDGPSVPNLRIEINGRRLIDVKELTRSQMMVNDESSATRHLLSSGFPRVTLEGGPSVQTHHPRSTLCRYSTATVATTSRHDVCIYRRRHVLKHLLASSNNDTIHLCERSS